MMGCDWFSTVLQRRKKRRGPPQPVPIEIRIQLSDNTEAWRLAILSCNPNSESNMISQKLVTNILSARIQALDKEATTYEQDQMKTDEVDGYVDLVWCFEKSSKRMHNTRFLVTSCYSPPYDAVLGKKDAEHVGMLES
ncbi:hypothetical protein BKA66DRAFT_466053 [Pyrenochaeta sp. MPI-SDFR-AT-0127]|nr:hypothetical protein BKA66DRAFT_466053 [Pyrenochaeta sp. MPI-SDFR-AT-0127]